ncbi:MAG: phosphatase PAP2 family protein [Candidatus Riflebacteria bacterium]|nr:phosphatase PAP2 family protein [Candidatus Riflebacteria bacterium]
MSGWRRSLAGVLRAARLEDVLCLAGGLILLGLFLFTSLVSRFLFGLLDFCFILLPLLVLLGKVVAVEVISSLRGRAAPPPAAGRGDLAPGGDPSGAVAGATSAAGGGGEDDPEAAFRAFVTTVGHLLRDWFPFLILSATYFSLYSNFILRVNPHTADAFLGALDQALLGHQAAVLLEPWIHPSLTWFLDVVYGSYLLYFPTIALFFYLYKQQGEFRRLMLGFMVITFLGVMSYILVPAVGPLKHFHHVFSLDLQGNRIEPVLAQMLNRFRVVHDCFPSLHVGIPLLVSLILRTTVGGWWFAGSLVYVALMSLATVYLRYHYLVDVLAAYAYAPAAVWLGDFLLARWPGWQARLADRVAPEEPAP